MVEISEIKDRESFEAWLDETEQPREHCVWLAYRAAMRVLPIGWSWFHRRAETKGDLTTQPILRCSLISGVAAVRPTPEIKVSAYAADAYATADAAYAAYAADAYAAAYAAAAATADAAAAATAATAAWEALRADCTSLRDGLPAQSPALWQATENPFQSDWQTLRAELGPPGQSAETARGSPSVDWSFWVDWYDRVLKGEPQNWDLLEEIALKDDDFWNRSDAEVNRDIAAIAAKFSTRKGLSAAYPVDFTFDDLACVMRMIGIDSSMSHLRDPKVVQSFLDDTEQLQELLQDFAYDARALSGGNYAGVLHRRANRVLEEFTRTSDKTHLRAELLVEYARDLELHSKEPRAREVLGETLSKQLDSRIGMLKRLCRTHFGPSYLALAPLAQLASEHIDRDMVLEIFDRAIQALNSLPSENLRALDAPGLAVLQDMLRELHETRQMIAAADDDEFAELLEARFAETSGSFGLALGRFYEQSANSAGAVSRQADALIKRHKQVESLADIVGAISETFPAL